MAATQKVNITAEKIEKGFKAQTVFMIIKFDGSEKEYSYVRKYEEDKEGNLFSIISGCRVTFTKEFTLLNITREYDVAGYKRRSTAGIIGKRDPKNPTTPEVEIVPEVKVIPQVEENGEVRHEKYEMIKACLECNIPIYLAGPAGSGKNHTVEQIARELNWNFYFSNSVQQEFKLTGFIDAGGDYHGTEFYKACTDNNDCIFFLDEMDASIPEVLVLLNAAIANGYFEFPNGRVDLKHVHFVAAGNTVGSGADEMYTGRLVLDQATLDRFAIIDFDYSVRIEMAISKNNEDLVNFIHELRTQATDKGIRATFSYRCITMVTKLESTGMDLKDILKIAVMKGLDKDTIKTFTLHGTTKYHRGLRGLQVA